MNFNALNELGQLAAETSRAKGFAPTTQANFAQKAMLMVTEIAEAVEDDRRGAYVTTIDETGKPHGLPNELADVFIRLVEATHNLGIDLGEEVRLKMAYNATRPTKHGGKGY